MKKNVYVENHETESSKCIFFFFVHDNSEDTFVIFSCIRSEIMMAYTFSQKLLSPFNEL